jgi:hypothetical protein
MIQPLFQVKLSLKAELALVSLNPAQTMKVYLATNFNKIVAKLQSLT